MEPISAIVGISALGYFIDQFSREKNFNNNNGYNYDIPVENVSACAEQYPWNFVESFEDNNVSNQSNKSNKKVSWDMNNNLETNLETNPLTPSSINYPHDIHSINNAGNPPADYLINSNERPVEDFVVNNMVPFFKGNGTNQDMRGTGVSQANITSDKFNLGNDHSTPNYTTLATFTGYDNTYLHKREAPNFFSPNERRDRFTIPGEDASAQRPLRDRYTTSILTKPDEKPFESIKVGPGINVSSDLPNDGQGFNSGLTNRVMPNNVGAYKLTPLAGRVAGTKYQASNLPTAMPGSGPTFNDVLGDNGNNGNNGNNINNGNNSNGNDSGSNLSSIYGVPNNSRGGANRYYTLEERPVTATPGLTQAPMHYSNYVFPSNTDKRTVTNVEFGHSIKIQ
jgi:hypothetical protein